MDQFLNKHHSKFSQMMDFVYFLVVTNFFAIIGTVIGLGVFGLFPSLVTTYVLIRMRIRGESFSIREAFVSVYKTSFIRSNQLGRLLMLLWAAIGLSWFFYLESLDTWFHWVGLAVIGMFAIILFFTTIMIPIAYAYFPKFTLKEYFKFSLVFALGMPVLSLLIALNLLFFYAFVLIRFISIFPFLAFSLPAYVNMILSNKRIMKIFTVYEDDHVKIRTLNSFGLHEQLYALMAGEDSEWPWIESNRFFTSIQQGVIEGRLSLVMMDHHDAVKGLMLSSYDGQDIHLELIWIDPSYQKRGYGSRMLEFIEKPLKTQEVRSVVAGSQIGFFPEYPSFFAMNLNFFRKKGYVIDRTDTGYRVRKESL